MSVLLNASSTHLFYHGLPPHSIEKEHRSNFYAFSKGNETASELRARLKKLVEDSSDQSILKQIDDIGSPVELDSFWNFNSKRQMLPITSRTSYKIPDISDELFFNANCYTVEHDIPYRERLLADRAVSHDDWLFDTKGKEETLRVLTYDIETTEYEEGKKDIPIDMVGWSEFDVGIRSHKDLDTEELDFQFTHLPTDWAEREVLQEVARNRDEELEMIHNFTKRVIDYDIIAGHNILGFDNKQVHDRIHDALRRNDRDQNLSPEMVKWFQEFVGVYSRPDRSFHFGSRQDTAVWNPCTLDTYHAARKFFFFHDDFTLKGLAPWLGIEIPDRMYLDVDQMKLDDATRIYNKHDVQEQLGLTQNLIAQALPLAFTVNLPLDELLTGGNTKMWDHMALIRARKHNRITPATSRAMGVARTAQYLLPKKLFPTREEVAEAAYNLPSAERDRHKEFIRVCKQGPEMPFWLEHPQIIANTTDQSSETGYEIVGGLTLKPDSDLKSHFVPWYHVVEADVGAMYPTLLKAQNLTADTVRPAFINEAPDEWIWLFHVHKEFVESGKFHVKANASDDPFTKGRGFMVGIKKRDQDGLVNLAMTGIMQMIQKVKDARAAAKKAGRKDEQRVLDMTYASLKAARNAGTHGIMVAVNVSCRQFNVWGGSAITTIGQKILHDTQQDFEAKGIRVVYGDTDGIYLGCSKNVGNLPHFAASIGSDAEPTEESWITTPQDAIAAIKEANDKWRKILNYEGFELEAEQSDAMVFIVHKNYLKFTARGGKFQMDTKGNNFKGSDKAPIARVVLEDIMKQSLLEVSSWEDEETAREAMKIAIKRATKDFMAGFDVRTADLVNLTLRQQVQPIKKYQANQDGSASNFAVRTAALEHLLGEPINQNRKLRFLVCKEPLPAFLRQDGKDWVRTRLQSFGLGWTDKKLTKASVKPIEYMWPIDHVKPEMIDWDWYRDTIEAYIKGAFGFNSLELATQRNLSSWF